MVHWRYILHFIVLPSDQFKSNEHEQINHSCERNLCYLFICKFYAANIIYLIKKKCVFGNEMMCIHNKWRAIFEMKTIIIICTQYLFINEELEIIIIYCNIVLFLSILFANKLSSKVNFSTAFEFHLVNDIHHWNWI